MKPFFKTGDSQDLLNVLNFAQAIIEFAPDGTILTANQNFLDAMGYTLDEIKGKHHSLFVDKDYAKSPDYKAFWERLANGEHFTDEFRRFGKGGKEIWIQASYNPVPDKSGHVCKVVKFATDITDARRERTYYQGQIEAIGKAQAVIEFEPDGTIITANQNFLDAVGYTLDEIKGQHHRIFVDPAEAQSKEYQELWDGLRHGEHRTGEFRRFGRDGQEIWIQATYNPILDMNGRVFKFVKFATDITGTKRRNADFEGQIEAISKAQAVIEFETDGTIVTANPNFLQAVGYTLDEIKGKHHSIFVDPAYASGEDYKHFWERLRAGEHFTAEFQRFGKGGREIWIQATYNPIFDMSGDVFKVVKFATDISRQVGARQEAERKSNEASENIQTVTSATAEMLTSINEINSNMAKSQSAIRDIIQKNQNASNLTSQLQDNTKAMEGIVELIRGISEQVNLLALNATIEAARAGEAGKGFAVVAGEVKSLANETAKATDQISQEIESIQRVVDDVVNGGKVIVDSTTSVGEYIETIVAAMEEQTAVTNEISENMQKINQGFSDLDNCIQRISATG